MQRTEESGLRLSWSGRWRLTHRILAVNILALALLAGSIFYLDSFRTRLTTDRIQQTDKQARMIADALAVAEPQARADLLRRLGQDSRARLRVFGTDGDLIMDSWEGAKPTYNLRDPELEPWTKRVAQALDNAFDAIVGEPQPPPLVEPTVDRLAAWPEAVSALRSGRSVTDVRRAPEGTAFVSAAAPTRIGEPAVLLLTANARDVRRVVRGERLTLGLILLAATILSVLLSLFLARTIARPLRRLALAAQRVRLGRAREVNVPRLPRRTDEIGTLARALHDMTQTLRYRIDATEAFAADVTHELKNPLASLRSAVDSLERVEDPELRRQLLDVVRSDVGRLDRLIVDIAEVSRLDAELTRARFEPIDLAAFIDEMVPSWEARAHRAGASLAFARPRAGSAVMLGEPSRLARAVDNIVDNAISFSPAGGLIEITAAAVGPEVVISIEDEGPGVPQQIREAIFNRFHSIRPDSEAFGGHSGLGLSIAKAIVDGHDGRLAVEDRLDGRPGARFVLRFPAVAETPA